MVRILLHKAQTWTKTDVRYLISGGGKLMAGQVGVSVIGLVSSIAFANLLTKEAYGTYQYVLTAVDFLAAFSLIGLSRALITSVARGHDGTLDFAFKRGLIWSIGAVALGLLIGGYYFFKGNNLLAIGIGLGTILTLLIATSKIYISFLNAKKLFGLTSLFTVLGLLIPAIAIIATLFVTQNLLTIILVYFVTNTLTNIALFLWSRGYATNKSVDTNIIDQSLHLSAQNFIGRIATHADRILLFQYAGPVVLAEFWIAQNIQRNFSHLFKSANSIVLPKLSVRSYDKLQRSLPRKLILLYAFIIPFTLLYVLITPYLIKIFFPLYVSTTLYTQVFGLLFLFLPIKVLSDVFVGHGMHNVLYRTTVVSSIAKLVATLSLVPFFGIWGVMLSVYIDQIVRTVLLVWHFLEVKDHRA